MLLTVTQKVIIKKITQYFTVKRRNAADTDDIGLGAIPQAVFKICSPFKNCRTEINKTFVNNADFINITMPMHNLIEYSDNYSDTSSSLWEIDKIDNNANVTYDNNAPSFKYKASIIGDTENNGAKNKVKIAVPLNI